MKCGSPRIAFAVAVLVATCTATGARADDACVLRAELDGVIHSAATDYLKRAVAAAERGRCGTLLVVINTPGGALEATRAIATTFLQAETPLVAYVHPSGARAGSAGLFVTAAAHVAAMAPGTNIGAAHPVTATGRDPEESGGDELARKIENDTAAFARAIGEQRGRNVAWLEKAVLESASVTAREARELNVIDVVASSVGELLEAIDGREITTPSGQLTLRTAGARVVAFERTIRERVLSVLGHPNVTYPLLMLGMLGLLVELYNPGIFVAGGAGLLCLLLAALGLNLLPVQVGAVVLLAVAVALFVAELYVTSFGLLTLAGAGALALGSALFIDRTSPEFFAEPSVRVSWGVVVPMVLVLSAVAGAFAWQAARLRGRPQLTGAGGLEGAKGKTATEVNSEQGWVRVHGERWRAVCGEPLPPATPVRVQRVEGLTLVVAPETRGDSASTPTNEGEHDV